MSAPTNLSPLERETGLEVVTDSTGRQRRFASDHSPNSDEFCERPITLWVECSWCKCELGTKHTVEYYKPKNDGGAKPTRISRVTSGICDPCLEKHYPEEEPTQ